MISFFVCLAILIIGYFTYGAFVEKQFAPDARTTPAVEVNDGVDYVVLPKWKIFLIQLLNIAGTGPIFGALAGAIWGPVVFFWITFGTIFAGGVHDYLSGMLSVRHGGKSISEIAGYYLGEHLHTIMRFFSVILLIMVGIVFAVGPADLLVVMFKETGMNGLLTSGVFWLLVIMIYYFIASFVSIDKIIGKIYPVFGICLIVMAVGVLSGIFTHGYHIPEIWTHFENMHPENKPIWPFMFVVVACGAISGFHSTQSPIMARCLEKEQEGRFTFYGAMVAEGVIALVWAAAGCAVYGSSKLLAAGGGNSTTVYFICKSTMGSVGMVLAMLGVIVCPITSGDTAFRSARMTIADWFNIDTGKLRNRLYLCILVLGIGALVSFGKMFGFIDYTVIWNYFSWSNQTLAMIVLWAASIYLARSNKNYFITAIPATFMSAVSVTYFMIAPECLGMIPFLSMNTLVGYPVGIIAAALFLLLFMKAKNK